MNIKTSRTLPPSCMYCLGELSRMVGTPANMLFPSERDSAKSSNRPPPRARFLRTGMPAELPGLGRHGARLSDWVGRPQWEHREGGPSGPSLQTVPDLLGVNPQDRSRSHACKGLPRPQTQTGLFGRAVT